MSKIINNPILKGLRGMLGKVVYFREVNGRMQMANRPKPSAKKNEKLGVIRSKFLDATQYAKRQNANAESKALYTKGITDKKHSAYVVALSDFLKAPNVDVINALGYKGVIGNSIVLRATDDFMVTAVKVTITSATGTVIEQGDAVLSPDNDYHWLYTATVANAALPGTIISATAYDRPGNTGSLQVVL